MTLHRYSQEQQATVFSDYFVVGKMVCIGINISNITYHV